MILIDTPRPTDFRSFRRTSHCASTLLGDEGTRELLEFAERIGLQERWIQNRGEPKEHFDLFGAKIANAKLAGATQVTSREFIDRIVRPKREAANGQ